MRISRVRAHFLPALAFLLLACNVAPETGPELTNGKSCFRASRKIRHEFFFFGQGEDNKNRRDRRCIREAGAHTTTRSLRARTNNSH